MTFLFYQAACRRNCQEIHGRQDDIQQQSRCWISWDSAAKSACLFAGKKGDTDRVPGGWEKKKKEYLSGLTFALNSLLLKLIIFTEINSNYLSFYGLQVCSAKNPIMHLSVSVKEVSVCDCFHTKAVISNWLDYICLKRWQIGSIRSVQDKLLELPVFSLLIDLYKTLITLEMSKHRDSLETHASQCGDVPRWRCPVRLSKYRSPTNSSDFMAHYVLQIVVKKG